MQNKQPKVQIQIRPVVRNLHWGKLCRRAGGGAMSELGGAGSHWGSGSKHTRSGRKQGGLRFLQFFLREQLNFRLISLKLKATACKHRT